MESMKNELAYVYDTSSGNLNRKFDSGSQNTKKVRKLLEKIKRTKINGMTISTCLNLRIKEG